MEKLLSSLHDGNICYEVVHLSNSTNSERERKPALVFIQTVSTYWFGANCISYTPTPLKEKKKEKKKIYLSFFLIFFSPL
jgi:hypothetical protein